jgi:hypothetical protein
MNDVQIRALLDEASAGPRPSPGIDLAAAVRRAESIRRRRRGVAVAASTLAVAAAVAAPVALRSPAAPRPTATSAPTSPPAAGTPSGPARISAPTEFDPLIRRVRIGWLPSGLLDQQWELRRTGQQYAGRAPGRDNGLLLTVLARGQRFDPAEHGIGLPEQPREAPAEPIGGRPAFCIGEAGQPGSCEALRWEYAPGAYARVSYAGPLATSPASTAALLRRVAQSVTLVAGEPVRLPFQVDLAGTGLRPTSTLVTIAGTGRPWSASLELSATPQPNPYDFHGVLVEMLSTPGRTDKDGPANTTVDGHSATLGQNGDERSLAVYNVRGSRLLIDVTTPGKDPLALYPAVHPVAQPADPTGWAPPPR